MKIRGNEMEKDTQSTVQVMMVVELLQLLFPNVIYKSCRQVAGNEDGGGGGGGDGGGGIAVDFNCV